MFLLPSSTFVNATCAFGCPYFIETLTFAQVDSPKVVIKKKKNGNVSDRMAKCFLPKFYAND